MKKGSPCHRCPHGVTDSEGVLLKKFKGKKIENMPCNTCKLKHRTSIMNDTDANNSWKSKISISSPSFRHSPDYEGNSSLGDMAHFTDAEETGWGEERKDWTDDVSKHPELILEAFAEFVRMFFDMGPKTQRAVVCWLAGKPLVVCADEFGMSPQGVHKILANARISYPVLEEVKKSLTTPR